MSNGGGGRGADELQSGGCAATSADTTGGQCELALLCSRIGMGILLPCLYWGPFLASPISLETASYTGARS